jgi:chromosome segregation ATPase
MRTLFIFLFLFSLQPAEADCNTARRMTSQAVAEVNARNGKINQLNAGMTRDQADVDRFKDLRDARIHTVDVHNNNTKNLDDAQKAVTASLTALKSLVDTNDQVKTIIDNLKGLNSGTKLSDQIRSLTKSSRALRRSAGVLEQLAGQIAQLETLQSDWAAMEKEVLENYLAGKESLTDGLFRQLSGLEEKLRSDLTTEANDLKADVDMRDRLVNQLKADQDRIDAARAQIAALSNEIQVFNGQYNRFRDEADRCNKPEAPRESLSCQMSGACY